MVQPIDTNNVKFYLHFQSGEDNTIQIDEPVGWDSVELVVSQDNERHGREFSFNDDKVKLSFYPNTNNIGHQFDKLIEYHKNFGFESKVDLIVRIYDEDWIIAELQFEGAETNRETYFEIDCEVFNLRKKIERLKEKEINLLGSEDFDGNTNAPVEIRDVTLRAKEILEISNHKDADNDILNDYYYNNSSPNFLSIGLYGLFGNKIGSSIEQTLSYQSGYIFPDGYVGTLEFGIAVNNFGVTHIINEPSEIKINAYLDTFVFNVERFRGKSIAMYIVTDTSTVGQDPFTSYNVNVVPADQIIQDTDRLDVAEWNIVTSSAVKIAPIFRVLTNSGGISRDTYVRVYESRLDVEIKNIFPDTTAKMTRLINAGEKLLSVISNDEVSITAPSYVNGGKFWDFFITSGLLIRGFNTSKFTLKYEDWLDFIRNAFNSDVQINGNDVFIGRYEEYYTNNEVARFDFQKDIDTYKIEFWDERMLNGLNMKYNKYEDDDKNNTLDAFHTESEWLIPNKKIGKARDLDINFTADNYSIEYIRREGIQSEPTTAKNEDNDVYVIDVLDDVSNVINLQNRTNEGFVVSGIFSPETTGNYRLSLKRLLVDHWGWFISECASYLELGNPQYLTKALINTFFKANGELTTEAVIGQNTYQGDELKENDDVIRGFLPDPIIEPIMYEFTLAKRVKYSEIKRIFGDVINVKGYISFSDNDTILKLYPKELKYKWKSEKLTIKGVKKYE